MAGVAYVKKKKGRKKRLDRVRGGDNRNDDDTGISFETMPIYTGANTCSNYHITQVGEADRRHVDYSLSIVIAFSEFLSYILASFPSSRKKT